MRAPHRERGFTVVELMVVVTVLGILAAIAAPNMIGMIRKQKVKTAAFDVFSSLNLARSEAIKRNRQVTLRPTGSDWSRGWQIADSAGNVIKDQSGWEDITMAGPGTVTFSSNGRGPTSAVQFDLSSRNVDTTAKRCITLDSSGRATSKEGSCS